MSNKFKENKTFRVMKFKLAKHFSLPINEQSDLKKHDPLAYITGSMTQLKHDDILAMQVIIRPVSKIDRWLIKKEYLK